MRVKLLTRGAGPDGVTAPGMVIEVDDATAAGMVANHRAIYTLEPVTKIERPVATVRRVPRPAIARQRVADGDETAWGG